MPILRHWANNGGVVGDYGGVAGSVLVIRAMSAVYNYDYIQVSTLGQCCPAETPSARGGFSCVQQVPGRMPPDMGLIIPQRLQVLDLVTCTSGPLSSQRSSS
jgi:hypothetical protein